ncbi:MAG: CCA tRNA nucleotidyltransferase [Candidatus Marsarchaeota archaeon]|nr:CCA tRNA nucleotidyltransferase [Candidatus Marsarchaeota archaeon]
MNKINAIFERILKTVKPREDEIAIINSTVNEMMSRLKKVAGNDVEIMLTGSVARGTNVRGNYDIDIFLLFKNNISEEEMEKQGIEIAKKTIKKHRNETYVIKYAEHPYLMLNMNDRGITIDLVPSFKIKDASERVSAVDRTQLHNQFINSNFNEKLRDDVRLLKTFLASNGIYGAEARIEGFSGYLCELLIFHFGSFSKFLSAVSSLKLPAVIDIKNNNSIQGMQADFVKKFSKDFIVIDPVDENRNVAANVSSESLSLLMLKARKFLAEPSISAFYGPKFSDVDSKAQIKKIREGLGLDVYVLTFKVPDIAEDIIWQQIKKMRKRIEEVLKQSNFAPELSFQNISDRFGIISFFINPIRCNSKKVAGPQIIMANSVDAFMKKHRKPFVFIEGDKIYSMQKQVYTLPEELLREIANKKIIEFPSYIKKEKIYFYKNKIPEQYAKILNQVIRTKLLWQ